MLTPEQVRHFRDRGYVAVERFFGEAELSAMLAELERFKRQGLGRNVATDGDGKTPSTAEVNYQIIPLNDKSDLFRALPFQESVLTAVEQLIGIPFARHLDQIFLKPGRSGAGTDWHQDNAYFKLTDPTKGTAMWIALHDATLENGTLHVVPNSHLEVFEHRRDPGSDHHIHMVVDEERAVPVVLSAGGAVFFNYGIAHATKRNQTDRERAGLAYHFLRTDSTAMDPNDKERLVYLTGPLASGGEREYGVRVAGTWADEVQRLTSV
jgi:ectoine hydroxylase-related dioxygenase (phytanoyl-CoA dioxygenase family)